MPKTPISWKFEGELLKELKKLADADKRPLNNLIEKILTDYVKQSKLSTKEIEVGLRITIVNYFLYNYRKILADSGHELGNVALKDIISIGQVSLKENPSKKNSYDFVVNFRVNNHMIRYAGTIRNDETNSVTNESVTSLKA